MGIADDVRAFIKKAPPLREGVDEATAAEASTLQMRINAAREELQAAYLRIHLRGHPDAVHEHGSPRYIEHMALQEKAYDAEESQRLLNGWFDGSTDAA